MISEISCSLLAIVAESPAPLWPTLELGENRGSKDKVENSYIFRFCTQQWQPSKLFKILLPVSQISLLELCCLKQRQCTNSVHVLQFQTTAHFYRWICKAQQEGHAWVNIEKGALPLVPLPVGVLGTLTGFCWVWEMFISGTEIITLISTTDRLWKTAFLFYFLK